MMKYSVVIPCAGIGRRMNLGFNKMLYQMSNQKTVIENTVSIFINDNNCQEIILVCNQEDRATIENMFTDQRIQYANGGLTRQESVYHGLLNVTNEYVLIHDGARCYLKQEYINALLECLSTHSACLLMVELKDTIKVTNAGKVVKTLPRESLMAAQTPQAFTTDLILLAYQRAQHDGFQATDDVSLVEHYGLEDVYVVKGDYQNIKVTTIEDIKEI